LKVVFLGMLVTGTPLQQPDELPVAWMAEIAVQLRDRPLCSLAITISQTLKDSTAFSNFSMLILFRRWCVRPNLRQVLEVKLRWK
jgi:hypothetical protein